MPRIRNAERALSLLASSSTTAPIQRHVCLNCRRQALPSRRTLHTTPYLRAEESFLTRIRQTVFGSSEAKEAGKKREEARQQRIQELAETPNDERTGGVYVDPQGREWEVAPVVDGSLNPDYVPAQTWEGLDRIGSEAWVRQRADAGDVYYGFSQPDKIQLTDDQWKRLLHHVAVEVLALRQTGRNIAQVCHQRSRADGWQSTRHISIATDGNDVTIAPTEEISFEEVVGAIPATAQEAGQATAQTLKSEAEGAAGKGNSGGAIIAQEDDAWMQLPLSEPAIKLTIIKRTTQLSGHRLRDTAISSAKTLADLFNAFKTKEKPKKLSQSEKMQALRGDNPNVTVHVRRQTPIDKHKAVGRWKLITDELRQRDLPVTGSRWRDAKTTAGLFDDGKSKKRKKARKSAR